MKNKEVKEGKYTEFIVYQLAKVISMSKIFQSMLREKIQEDLEKKVKKEGFKSIAEWYNKSSFEKCRQYLMNFAKKIKI